MPRDLLHQSRQRMFAEPVEPAPHPVRHTLPSEDRELEAEMGEAMADRARQRQPIDVRWRDLDRLGDGPRFGAPRR